MFHLLPTTKCKRQQIAMLIISYFAYVAGIRNEGNNMLLQQQQELLQQGKTSHENSYYESPTTSVTQQPASNFRPSEIIDFTPADATISQHLMPNYMEFKNFTNNNKNNSNNSFIQKQEIQNVNRRLTIATAAINDRGGEKKFSFPNEQQQGPQYLTDKPIFIYRDPFTNENFHHTSTPTETDVKYSTIATTHNHNNYNNNENKQQNSQHQLQYDNDNQEYFVQSSMIVGAQQQPHYQQENNPTRPYMSLSADKDVYLKRPGFVYDEKPNYNHPNSVIDKKSEDVQTLKVNKISYDSHDYPPPSYFQQQTSNFLPTPVPHQISTSRPKPTPTPPPPLRQDFRPTLQSHTTIFNKQRPQQQYLQSSQSMLHNYPNSIDNYLWNKQQTSEYYRTEMPPQQQQQYSHENRPSLYDYDARPQPPPTSTHNFVQNSYPKHESAIPPSGRPFYYNYHDYQIGEIPPLAQQLNSPYPRPPAHYPHQGLYRPQPPPQQQHQSGLATLAQYAPQFTSLFLSGVGGAGGVSNSNGPLGNLIGALTGAAPSQQSTLSSSSHNRRPINSQLIKALENIARNDDFQCVPKVLCQMIAAQTQRGQLPTFITSPAITNFLAEFPAASPALIYGRAALLGLSGGEKSCFETYSKCPKSEYEIINYLNNHRGGFFKFFSEPEEQQQAINHNPTQQAPISLFSILAALTGSPQAPTTTPRPTPRPQPPSTDITSGIGNFFTQLLSDYMDGATVEYQRRFNRRSKRSLGDKIKFEGESQKEEYGSDALKFQFQDEHSGSQVDVLKFKDKYYDVEEISHPDNDEDFHDEEDEEDTYQGVNFKYVDDDYLESSESRILQKISVGEKRLHFFPEMKIKTLDDVKKDDETIKMNQMFSKYKRENVLKFPTSTDKLVNLEALLQKIEEGKTIINRLTNNGQNYGHHFTNYEENSYDDSRNETRKIKFIENDNNEENAQSLYSNFFKSQQTSKTRLAFPERVGKIVNYPYYDASYLHQSLKQEESKKETDTAQEASKYIIPNREEDYTKFPLTNVHNTNINVLNPPANLDTSNKIIYFLPTPSSLDTDNGSSNLIYSNTNYNESQQNYDILYQSSYYNPQKYPSATFFNSLTNDRNHYPFDKPERYTIQNNPPNFHRNLSSEHTTRRPFYSSEATTTRNPDNKNIYVTNSQGVTEYFVTPDGKKVYL